MSVASIAPAGQFRAALAVAHRLRAWELTPFVVCLLVPLIAPQYLALATQVVVSVIFAMALDLLVGYAGVVTLGHAVYFGLGAYTAGILSARGWGEAISGLAAAAVVSGLAGALLGAIMLRTSRFTLLMLSLTAVFLASEVANKMTWLTGGVDGLPGIVTWPILGRFELDLFGYTGFAYACAVLVVAWAALRWLLHAPLGQTVMAIRDNRTRAAAIGTPVLTRLVQVHALSCALAGVAGALQTQIAQFVGLNAIGFELSATALVMLALGGTGRLYGAFVGPAVFLVAQDAFARDNPVLAQFWLGALVVAIVLFAPGGLLGLVDRARGRSTR